MSEPRTIRWMMMKDLDKVIGIERLCFGDRAWDEDDFLGLLRERTTIQKVVDEPDVRGFIIYTMARRCIRIQNVAVHPEWRGTGRGQALIEQVKHSATRRMIEGRPGSVVVAIVDETALAAHCLLRKCGFRAISIVKDESEDERDYYEFEWRPED